MNDSIRTELFGMAETMTVTEMVNNLELIILR